MEYEIEAEKGYRICKDLHSSGEHSSETKAFESLQESRQNDTLRESQSNNSNTTFSGSAIISAGSDLDN